MPASTFYLDRLRKVQEAIQQIEDGGSGTIGTTSYGESHLKLLYAREELLSIQAAIQAINEGAQSYTIGSRTFERGNMFNLFKRLDLVRARIARIERGGIRQRQIIPR